MERIIPARKPTVGLTSPADLRHASRSLPEGELAVARKANTNTLLIGPTWATDAAIDRLMADRDERVWFWTPAQPIRISERTVVVIREVGMLSPYLQADWMAALGGAARERPLQVISTNSFSIFPFVERGVFLEALYYRLNCVLIDFRRGPKTRLAAE